MWTILLAFDDFAWVADRTNTWDAIGASSYEMVYAVVESVIVFLVIVALGFLLPKRWEEDKRIAMLGILILGVEIWAILSQRFFFSKLSQSSGFINFLMISGHPLWILYGSVLLLIGLTVVLPSLLVVKKKRARTVVLNIFDRLSVLTTFYLFLDFFALVIVLGRNL